MVTLFSVSDSKIKVEIHTISSTEEKEKLSSKRIELSTFMGPIPSLFSINKHPCDQRSGGDTRAENERIRV